MRKSSRCLITPLMEQRTTAAKVHTHPFSQGKVISVNTATWTAKNVHAFQPPDGLLVKSQCSTQLLPNGNALVNLGSEGAMTEFRPDGTPIFPSFRGMVIPRRRFGDYMPLQMDLDPGSSRARLHALDLKHSSSWLVTHTNALWLRLSRPVLFISRTQCFLMVVFLQGSRVAALGHS